MKDVKNVLKANKFQQTNLNSWFIEKKLIKFVVQMIDDCIQLELFCNTTNEHKLDRKGNKMSYIFKNKKIFFIELKGYLA